MNGAVRLVNGRRASEGSVQICVDGVWGHVCGGSWSAANTKVVCRQLGYSTMCKLNATLYLTLHIVLIENYLCNYPLTVYSPSFSLFNGGSQQPIIYGRMSCSGSEQTLSSCSNYVNYNSYCQTYKAGVVCESEYSNSLHIHHCL